MYSKGIGFFNDKFIVVLVYDDKRSLLWATTDHY